jgi:hypothetical protein
LFSAGAREGVELGAAVVLRRPPRGLEQPAIFEAVEGGVERALLDGEVAPGDLLDTEEDPVAVLGPERDGFEDEQVERAGKQVHRGHSVLS